MFRDENRNSCHDLRNKLCPKTCDKYHDNKNDWFYYHKSMLIENNTNMMKDRLEQLQESIGMCNHLLAEENITNDRPFFSNVCNDTPLAIN